MKKFIRNIMALAFALFFSASALSQNSVSYSLTRTCIILDVEARQEIFHSGPLARYSEKYLGVAAREEDGSGVEVVAVKVNTSLEADPDNRYTAELPENAVKTMLAFTSQGLVSAAGSTAAVSGEWRFPLASDARFAEKGLPANFETDTNRLNRSGDNSSVLQNVVVAKSLEKKAKEVADRIFEIRENRYKILVGDTDATYSGEAMKAAVDELDRLEKELLTLFVGYSEYSDLKAVYEVVPDVNAKRQMYVAFRVSDSEGLVGPDNISGRPFFLELTPETEASEPDMSKIKNVKTCIFYRCPAVCKAVLSDGGSPVLQTRIPVHQLGRIEYYYIK